MTSDENRVSVQVRLRRAGEEEEHVERVRGSCAVVMVARLPTSVADLEADSFSAPIVSIQGSTDQVGILVGSLLHMLHTRYPEAAVQAARVAAALGELNARTINLKGDG